MLVYSHIFHFVESEILLLSNNKCYCFQITNVRTKSGDDWACVIIRVSPPEIPFPHDCLFFFAGNPFSGGKFPAETQFICSVEHGHDEKFIYFFLNFLCGTYYVLNLTLPFQN